jgi:DinB superfamily
MRGIEQLEATPDILRLLLEPLTAGEAEWKPGPDRFSIGEVLEHLSHVEGHCFRLRVERMIAEENPQLEPYDPEVYAAAGAYSGRNAEDSFDHFEDQRLDNLEFLRNLPGEAAGRAGVHGRLGPITVAQLVSEWAFHDLGHIRQIAEIIRALKYYPHMGPFQTQYKINP